MSLVPHFPRCAQVVFSFAVLNIVCGFFIVQMLQLLLRANELNGLQRSMLSLIATTFDTRLAAFGDEHGDDCAAEVLHAAEFGVKCNEKQLKAASKTIMSIAERMGIEQQEKPFTIFYFPATKEFISLLLTAGGSAFISVLGLLAEPVSNRYRWVLVAPLWLPY